MLVKLVVDKLYPDYIFSQTLGVTKNENQSCLILCKNLGFSSTFFFNIYFESHTP